MIQGTVRIVVRDSKTNEIKNVIEEQNMISSHGINTMINSTDTTGEFGYYIVISEHEQIKDVEQSYIFNPITLGRTESGVTSPKLLSGNVGTGNTFAYYYQYQQRFDPPASEITIRTIGIVADGITSIPPNKQPITTCAYLPLTTPCTQLPTETLDVFYRIIFNNPENGISEYALNNSQIYALALKHLNGTSINHYYPINGGWTAFSRKFIDNVNGYYITDGDRSSAKYSTSGDTETTYYSDYNNSCRVLQMKINLSQCLGRMVCVAMNANLYNPPIPYLSLFYNPIIPNQHNPIQNIFSHGSNATGPFYSASHLPTGNGTLTINGDSWTNPDYNKLLRIEITGSGSVGVGTYKVWQRNCLGFVSNSYNDDWVAIPSISPPANFQDIMYSYVKDDTVDTIWSDLNYGNVAGCEVLPYDDVSVLIGYSHDTVIRYNIITAESQAWNADSTPAITFKDISQVVVDTSGNIWVADSQIGLVKISTDGNTVTTIDNTHTDLTGITSPFCYGTAITPGRVWAIMYDSLIYTEDGGTTFVVYNSGTTPVFDYTSEYNRYWFLQGDPTHTDHRLCIGYNTYSSYGSIGATLQLQIRWWDSVSGAGNSSGIIYNKSSTDILSQVVPLRRREICHLVSCSPNDSVWGIRTFSPQLWNYNGTSATYSYNGGTNYYSQGMYKTMWAVDSLGQDALLTTQINNAYEMFYALNQQDGSQVLSSKVNDAVIPSARTYNASSALAKNPKLYFKDSGIYVGCGYFSSNGTKAWYANIVSDQLNSDAGEFKNNIWREYGWNGSNWELDHAGSKTIHDTSDTLIDGLTVSFDDDGGTQTFAETDYYTTGVVDGILVDGGTIFDSRYGLYYRPTEFNLTDLDSGTLPVVQTNAIKYLNYNEISVMTDSSATTFSNDNYGYYFSSSTGAFYTRFGETTSDYAKMVFRVTNFSYSNNAMTIGLSDSSKIGSAVTADNIDYAIRVTNQSNNNYTIQVVSNGVILSTISSNDDYNYSNALYMYHTLERQAGSTDITYKIGGKVVYTFTGATMSIIPSVYSNYRYVRAYITSIHTSHEDYYINLGNSGSNTGVYDPDFLTIDYSAPGRITTNDVTINGSTVTSVLHNDAGRTALAAGEIDVLPQQGKIRFSASDVGKSIAISRYNVIKLT